MARMEHEPATLAGIALLQRLGRRTIQTIEETGYLCTLLVQSLYWIGAGRYQQQPVRIASVMQEAMDIGVKAALIVSLLCFAVGIMLAIQGIETLKTFGAQTTVIIGIALSITREFSPLIVSILVAGRSGSAITARIGFMLQSQEIDALRVMGINPVRFLAAPILLGTLIMVPTLTILGDLMGLLGGGVYTSLELGMTLGQYTERVFRVLALDDIRQGLIKSVIFAVIIALIAIGNGFQVKGGAQGVGTATTRCVVLAISFVILADMIFTFVLNR